MSKPVPAALGRESSRKNEEEIIVEGDNDEPREFPDAFYDPTSGRIMIDPVVNAAGDSYEKTSAVLDAELGVIGVTTHYPNRSLKAIIRRETQLADASMAGSLRRMDKTKALRSRWSKLVDKSYFPVEYRPLPDSFYCPITCDLMVDPVISRDGNSYEREAIENWVRANKTSPITRNALTIGELRDNNNLYDLIQIEKGRADQSLHPSIRRWKESGIPTSRRPLPEETKMPPPSAPPADQETRMLAPSTPPSFADQPTAEDMAAAARLAAATSAANVATATAAATAAAHASMYPTTPAGIRARRRERREELSRRCIQSSFITVMLVTCVVCPPIGFIFILIFIFCPCPVCA